MKHPIQAIIFDLDGTLIDSIRDIAGCANAVLKDWGDPVHSVETYTELIGDGLRNLARKVLPMTQRSPEEIERFVTAYREYYQTRWRETSMAYEGIPELLSSLAERGIPLAVLSNKRDDFTRVCVDHFFPSISFHEVRGERAGVPIKPDPQAALEIATSIGADPTRCLFVGDSEIDVQTGIRAGMTSVAVTWGFRPIRVLEEAGATVFISKPKELLGLLSGAVVESATS
jgi:phosphoglycolate phosphatase